MRAIIRVTAELPEGSWGWGPNATFEQESRAFSYYVLERIKAALPEYASMLVVVGAEDNQEDADLLLHQPWVSQA